MRLPALTGRRSPFTKRLAHFPDGYGKRAPSGSVSRAMRGRSSESSVWRWTGRFGRSGGGAMKMGVSDAGVS